MGKNDYVVDNGKLFINPYNFVSTSFDTVSRGERPREEEKLSGYLECSLTAKTPLSIPDEGYEKDGDPQGHMTYPFMNVNGALYIPGSSIRGVVRNIYETITDSCYSTVNGAEHISYRTKNAFKPGLLIKKAGEYELLPATRYIIPVQGKNYRPISNLPKNAQSIKQEDLKNYAFGQVVYIEPSADTFTKKGYVVGAYINKLATSHFPGSITGYMCIGELFGRKHFESVFVPNADCAKKPVAKRTVDEYFDVLKVYNNPSVNKNAKDGVVYKNRLTPFEEGKFYPVWYKEEKGFTYLSPAQIGRTEYDKSMADLLKEKAACRDKKNACAACRLFGMVGDANNSIASRVRFSDAAISECAGKEYYILKELASGHPSYAPFYANSKDGWLSYDNDCTEINGRKYYWHIPEAANTESIYSLPDDKKSKNNRNATMELVSAGSRFSFKVYYDSISSEELKALIWALTLGDNSGSSDICQKIGHGKPLGLGSAKICVEKDFRRTYQEGNYSLAETAVEICERSSLNADGSAIEELIQISSFNFCKGYEVRYPYIEGAKPGDNNNRLAAHQWFTNNWKLGDAPEFFLPSIPEDDKAKSVTLSPMKFVGEETHTESSKDKTAGKIETATVIKMRPNGKFVSIKLSDGSNGSAWTNGKTYAPGTKLKVSIKSYNEQYNNYDCVII